MLRAHLGAIEQPVRLVQHVDPGGPDLVPFQPDDVDAADPRGVAVHQHEPRHIVDDPRLAADEAVAAHCDVMVDRHAPRDARVRLDVDVPAEHRVVGDRDPVAQLAVVRDVDVGHQEVIAADPSQPVFLLGGPVDRHALPDEVVIADLDARRRALVGDILGVAADDGEGADDVLLPDRRDPEHANVADQPSAPTDLYIGSDDAVGPDLHVIGQLRPGIDARRIGDKCGHGSLGPRFLEEQRRRSWRRELG